MPATIFEQIYRWTNQTITGNTGINEHQWLSRHWHMSYFIIHNHWHNYIACHISYIITVPINNSQINSLQIHTVHNNMDYQMTIYFGAGTKIWKEMCLNHLIDNLHKLFWHNVSIWMGKEIFNPTINDGLSLVYGFNATGSKLTPIWKHFEHYKNNNNTMLSKIDQ